LKHGLAASENRKALANGCILLIARSALKPSQRYGRVTISVRVYRLTSHELRLTHQTGPTLDAVSLHLPNGAYTTLRTYNTDRIIGLSAHQQRLIDSSEMLQRPYPIDPVALRAALRDVIARERLTALRLRITVPLEIDQIFISVEPFEVYPAEFYQHGVRCATTRLSRHTPQAKSTDFIAASRETKAASDPDIHELLMVNRDGEILEGISSNFYAVIEGVLRTAGKDVLEGITRQIALQEAASVIPIDYRPLNMIEIDRAAEAFITSSSREVMPVIQIDEQVIGTGQPGPIAQTLLVKYRKELAHSAETV
jgi:branched-chain amino acid aminotransferase